MFQRKGKKRDKKKSQVGNLSTCFWNQWNECPRFFFFLMRRKDTFFWHCMLKNIPCILLYLYRVSVVVKVWVCVAKASLWPFMTKQFWHSSEAGAGMSNDAFGCLSSPILGSRCGQERDWVWFSLKPRPLRDSTGPHRQHSPKGSGTAQACVQSVFTTVHRVLNLGN